MPVPSNLGQLSQTAALNSPAGSENVFPSLDDYERFQAAALAILRDGGHRHLTVSGTNTITGTTVTANAVSAYVTGQVFSFVAAGANTGAVTLNVNTLGGKSITKRGATALASGDIPSGYLAIVAYDGTQFQLINPADGVLLSGAQTVAGVKTFSNSPVVPTPSGGTDAANKAYVDAAVPAGTTSVAGLVELATNAETQALTDALRVVTPGGLGSIFSRSVASSGYVFLPGGLLLQWGNSAPAEPPSGVAVTFPIPFPNACFQVTTGARFGAACAITQIVPSTTGFTAYVDEWSGVGNIGAISYIAIGN